MGIYDREYYREEPRGLHLGAPRTMVMNLVVVNAAIFLVDLLFLKGQVADLLALQADLFRRPWQAWQLVTHGFVHADIFHVLFNMLGLWWFGTEMEHHYGSRRFLGFYLTGTILAGLGWVAAENLLFRDYSGGAVGASGAICAVMVLYAIHYPTRMFYFWGLFPVPVWLLVGVFLLQDFVSLRDAVNGSQEVVARIAYAAHLCGAAYGALYYRFRWSLESLLPGRLSLQRLKPRPKLRIHRETPRDGGDLEERLDRILEKIHREGEASLSREERNILEEASRRAQQRRR